MYGDTGKVKPFGQKDNGGDLVETAFLMQALLCVHQYYVLAAISPTHGVSAAVYHKGWAEDGAIVAPHQVENIPLQLRYQGTEAGPLFGRTIPSWALIQRA